MFLYSIKFIWWNIALSPAAPQAKTKANEEAYLTICNHIVSLFTDYCCDFIALCEIDRKDVEYFQRNLQLTDIDIIDLSSKVGRTRFDMAVIYNKNELHVRHEYTLSRSMTDNIIKASQVLEVENIDDHSIIYIFLCHWPSRLCGDGEARREAAANIVYSSAIDLMKKGKDVIIMGDFNDNPYDKSVFSCLKATRCHETVKKYPTEFLYNPFWRSVVSEDKYNHFSYTGPFRSGTHRYKQFLGTFWHSYDQIILSGSFLGGGIWHLNETETKVLSQGQLLIDLENNDNVIDHFPVACEIIRP